MKGRVAALLCIGVLLVGACVLYQVRLEQGEGALDVVLLSDHSEEVGPVEFPHSRHYDLAVDGGREIPCGDCHHDYSSLKGRPPGACRDCHHSHDGEEDRGDARVPFL